MGNRCSCFDGKFEDANNFNTRPRALSSRYSLPAGIFQSHPSIQTYAENIARSNHYLREELDFKDKKFNVDQFKYMIILFPHFTHIRRFVLSGTQPDMISMRALARDLPILQ